MKSIETTTSGPKISTRSQVELPVRTLVILNAKADKIDEEFLCDVRFSDFLEDWYPNLICILVLHQTSSITGTNMLLIMVNMSVKDIYPRKRCTWFSRTDRHHSNDLKTETVFEAVFNTKILHLM